MKRCALVIGHRADRPGACNKTYNICEFEFNSKLVNNIMASFADPIEPNVNIELIKVLRRTYKELPNDINKLNPDFIVSFHCNAFNGKTSGTETLYYYKSEKSRKAAEIFQKNLVKALNLPDRGIKGKGEEDRGGYLLKNTNAPCVLIEPFFIDNDKEFEIVQSLRNNLIVSVQLSIIEVMKFL